MRIGIMQPYFFPYLGYFQLIKYVDQFILFDDVQYISHGWINRNRILHPREGWQYIIMPLCKHSSHELIKNITINNTICWKEKIIAQLEHYKKKAPFYYKTMDLVKKCLDTNTVNIGEFNLYVLTNICEYLGIDTPIQLSSKLNFDYSCVNDAGEWALKISEQLHASEYINPINGKGLFDSEKFAKSKINLKYISMMDLKYVQKRTNFEPALSIIDVLMFNSINEVEILLQKFEVIK
jgi:hypothetical protein